MSLVVTLTTLILSIVLILLLPNRSTIRPHSAIADLRRAGHSGLHLDSGEGEDLYNKEY